MDTDTLVAQHASPRINFIFLMGRVRLKTAGRYKSLGYEAVDEVIRNWAKRNKLALFAASGGMEVRAIYVSSVAGHCYQIWINYPDNERICIHARCVEGPRDTEDSLEDWDVPISELDKALEKSLEAVFKWMKPSVRFLPHDSRH